MEAPTVPTSSSDSFFSSRLLMNRREAFGLPELAVTRLLRNIAERNIDEAVKSKAKQLQMADNLEKDGTFLKDRRAKLWRRCANMAEILAKEETEATLWQNRYREAIAVVSGSYALF
ncbi:hypothetical protein OS493_039230 [Desmophyllum pertusum]|uniref:Uncharacterized protein n=1 Tax=Desmophyllum pertusum TaxID=174260 RepID=A0A9W9Y6R1_9CNID|nr:hypothetical protein OS493_039230 [Desmophyllum pertusum]